MILKKNLRKRQWLNSFSKGGKKPSYPLTDIPSGTDFASPLIGHHHEIPNPYDNAEITRQYQEVLEVRHQVVSGEYPYEFLQKYWNEWYDLDNESPLCKTMLPEALELEGLSTDNPEGLANVVHMDNPLDLGISIAKWLRSMNVPVRSKRTNNADFISSVQDFNSRLVQYQNDITRAFNVKWYYGIQRPEGIAKENITAYDEGCPTHPAFPAGHGFFAGATYRAIVEHFDLSDEVKVEVMKACYLWAQFRTLAGVHYAYDNLYGLHLGGMLSPTAKERE